LDRLFLAQVGTALCAYYLEQRLERARQLVVQSSLSLLEIAIACGFTRASTFSKSYRRLFRVSPSADRANALRRWRAPQPMLEI
jgi:AraC family carnitine catabolism transcriptional activator